jgi:hypothetical protein
MTNQTSSLLSGTTRLTTYFFAKKKNWRILQEIYLVSILRQLCCCFTTAKAKRRSWVNLKTQLILLDRAGLPA